MARQFIEILSSDLSGTESDDVKHIKFGFKGQAYEIDLTEEEAEEFSELLDQYIKVARKDNAAPAPRRSAARGGKSVVEEQTGATPAQVRDWAKENGHEVSERGRIHQDVIDAYNAAH